MERILGIFGKKKEKEEEQLVVEETEEEPTGLELICGDDEKVYDALFDIMSLDPRKIEISMEEAVKKAKDSEKSEDIREATMWYEIAGKLAIYKGDVKKVKQYFAECQRLSGRDYPILKIPERAVKKAQEYYEKYLKAEEKK